MIIDGHAHAFGDYLTAESIVATLDAAGAQQVVEGLAAWCSQKSLPLFAHLYRRQDVPHFLGLCNRHPRTQFILGHLIGAEHVDLDSLRLDNLCFDTSPPQLVGEQRIMAAVRRFGSGRIMMGSDTPYGRGNLRRSIDRIDGLPLSSSDKDLMLGDNLAAVLKPIEDELTGARGGQSRERGWA